MRGRVSIGWCFVELNIFCLEGPEFFFYLTHALLVEVLLFLCGMLGKVKVVRESRKVGFQGFIAEDEGMAVFGSEPELGL